MTLAELEEAKKKQAELYEAAARGDKPSVFEKTVFDTSKILFAVRQAKKK